jgi:hypothetical protein
MAAVLASSRRPSPTLTDRMLIFENDTFERCWPSTPRITTISGHIERCSCVHLARKHSSPSRSTVESGADQCLGGIINEYEPAA